MSNVKLGVIGFGNMGKGHIRNVTGGKVPGMEIAAICDISEEKRKLAKETYPDIPVFENAEDMFKSGLCDSVIIATYHYSHPDLAMKAFEYGLNVITEKPAGVYTKQVKEMNEAATKTDKKFAIMYNQRTNPVYQKVPQAYHDSSSWRSTWKDEGGGTLINQNPHQLDLWQWMFGMPDKIYATMGFGKYYNIEVEDEVVALMEYNNGTIGQYITTTAEMPGTNRLEVAGDMGNLIVENDKITFKRNIMSEREFNEINTSAFGGLAP